VQNLADFNVAHADEITSADTDNARREDLAAAAMSLSLFVHLDGIGLAWAAGPYGNDGWYRALVTQVIANMLRPHRIEEQSTVEMAARVAIRCGGRARRRRFDLRYRNCRRQCVTDRCRSRAASSTGRDRRLAVRHRHRV
jgi:hypothetical protein